MILQTIKQNLADIYITGNKINEISRLNLNSADITGYVAALKGLSGNQAELILSTQRLTAEQQRAIMAAFHLAASTGSLTTAQMTEILVSKGKSDADAKALLLNTGLIAAESAEATATHTVTAAKLRELVQTKALTKAEAELIAAKAGVTLANSGEALPVLSSIGAKITGAAAALKGFGTGILTIASAHPVIAGITATLALCGGAAIVNRVKQENAAKAIKTAYEEAKNAIEEINNTYSSKKSQTKDSAKEYAELAQGVDLLSNANESLSTEKYERFLELSNQLSTLYPSLTKAWDENGNAILDLSGNVDTIVGSLDNLIDRQRQLANKEIVDQMPELFAGFSANVTEYEKQLEVAKQKKDNIDKAYEEIRKNGIYLGFNEKGNAINDNKDLVPLQLGNYLTYLEELGIAVKQIYIKDNYGQAIGIRLAMADGSDFPNSSEIKDIAISRHDKAMEDIKFVEQQLQAEKNSINQYLNTWLQTELSYNQLDNSGLQKAVQETIFHFDWSSLPDDIDKTDWVFVSDYLRRNILFSIYNIKDPEISKALADIYSGNLTSDALLDSIEKVQAYFGKDHAVTLSLQPKINATRPLINNVKEKLQDEFVGKVGDLSLEDLQIAAEKIKVSEDSLLSWDELVAKIEAFKEKSGYTIFSSFSDTEFGSRLQHITDLFKEGSLSHREYFNSLQSEINNFDASHFTDSIEDASKAAQQFFTDSVQQTADGLSGLIDSFDKGEISVTEYLEGYLSIGKTLSALTDNLQENSAAWNKSGEALSDMENNALDGTQNKLQSAISSIESWQDSIYSLEQIMTGAVTSGSDEFSAHAQVVAEDLSRIVQTGGTMADTVANTLGTTTDEIAQSLTGDVVNQEIACQAIAANTNLAISDMTASVGKLFDQLGDAISDFKVNISFGVKSIDWKKVNVLGKEINLPEIKFELGASGESLDEIGSAISSFGKSIIDNYAPQTIEQEDFHFGNTENGKNNNYKPNDDVLKNYNEYLNRLKASKSTASEYSELFDFFERRIKALDSSLSLLKANLSSLPGSFAKNSLLDAQISLNEEKINNYSDALALYAEKADEAFAKLPADLAKKVKEGAVSLTTFTGDSGKELTETIKDYETWAGKVNDCRQELSELKDTLRALELEKFNNLINDFTTQYDLHETANTLIGKQIALLKEAGLSVGEAFYTAQAGQAKKQLGLLEEEKAALIRQLAAALSSGHIEKGTDEWLEMVKALSDLDGRILDCKASIEEFDNAVLALHEEVFQRIQDRFSGFHSELEHLLSLFQDADVSDEAGDWTKEGLAQLGLLAQQYELARRQVQQYNDEIDKLNSDYLAGKYSAAEYADKLSKLTDAQWDAADAASSAEDAIIKLNEARVEKEIEGIEKEIDAYKELVDAQIDALRAAKDLHDYEETIAEKTKSIDDLERQIAAMQGDNTAAAAAKRKKLEEELAQAKKDLEDAEYDHSIEAQEDALNKQYEAFEEEKRAEIEALQESLKETLELLSQSFDAVRQNTDLIGQEITDAAQSHGVRVSEALIAAWQNGESAVARYGETLSAQTSAFLGSLFSVETEVWNLQAQADVAAVALSGMFTANADNLIAGLTTAWQSEETLNVMTNALQESLRNTLERGYDVSALTAALAAIASGAQNAAAAANSAADAFERLGAKQNSAKKLVFVGIDSSTGESIYRNLDNGMEETASFWRDFGSTYGISESELSALPYFAPGAHEGKEGRYAADQNNHPAPKLIPVQNDRLFPALFALHPEALLNPTVPPVRSLLPPVTLPEIQGRNIAPSVHMDKMVQIDHVDGANLKQVEQMIARSQDNFINKMYNGIKYRRI